MAHTDRQNDKQTDGHGDSTTDPAQRVKSVKIENNLNNLGENSRNWEQNYEISRKLKKETWSKFMKSEANLRNLDPTQESGS